MTTDDFETTKQTKLIKEYKMIDLRRIKASDIEHTCPVCKTKNGYTRKYCRYCKVDLTIAKKIENGI